MNFYYQQMNKTHQIVYREMLEGLKAIAPEFPVLKIDGKELADIFFQLRLDHPMIFYVCGFKYRFTEDSRYVQMIPEYMFEKKKIMEHQKALESRIQRLVRTAEKFSDEEKEAYIHDFICEHVIYDKLKKQYSHEIIGPLQQGIGVCEGIAKTVKVLCDRLNLDCMIAISKSNPEEGVKYRHAWNIIKLRGKWYHLDATFNNSLGRYGTKRFDYYNLSDKQLFRDHQPLLFAAPVCNDGDSFYYKENRLSLTKIEEPGKRLKAVLRKKQEHFVFHWRGGTLSREILKEILKDVNAVAGEKGKYITLSLNWGQSVVALHISEKKDLEDVAVETPDEAEGDRDVKRIRDLL